MVLKKTLILALLLTSLESSFYATFVYGSADERAKALVRAAIEKMGGEEKLRAVKSVQIDAIGHTYFIEQSERPEGPWIVDYQQIRETCDYAKNRLQRVTQERNVQAAEWTKSPTLIVSNGVAAMQGDRMFAGSNNQARETEESLALSSERVLLTALDAKDLHFESDTVLQGTEQHVVAFTWLDATVRLYLSSFTSMPTAIEIVRNYPGSLFWSVWGEVKTRIYLSLWELEAGGIRLPRQLNIERNGTPYQEFTITTLTLNPSLTDDAFLIPTDVAKAYEARARKVISDLPVGFPNSPPVELAQGIVQIPGNFNVTLVRQSDGIVIIEAPLSSSYSAKVFDEAKKRFPGLPIKALVSTSDAWPHIGGVREYVARDIPIYVLDLNRPILERLISSPHISAPDALARLPKKKPRFQNVSGRTILGSGANRIELYPIRSESGERGMIVYFPEHGLLYGCDLIQPLADGSFFMPEYLLELVEAVQRENLVVKKVFAMHVGATPWSEIQAAVAKRKALGL